MELTVTVVAAESGASADLRLTAPAGSPAVALLGALRRAVGAAADAVLLRGGRPIPDDGTIEDCGLRTGDVISVSHAAHQPQAVAEARYELVFTGGPDAARSHPLPAGQYRLGRDAGCELTVADPAVSRQQLQLDVADPMTVTDLWPANPTLVDGRPIEPGRPTVVAAGSVLRLGGSEAQIRRRRPRSGSADVVHRSPRTVAATPSFEVVFPTAPLEPARPRIAVIAAVAPLGAGLVLCVVLRQWQFLAFTALSPVMVLGQALSDRQAARRSHRAATREHRAATAQARARLAAHLEAERQARLRAADSLADLTAAARSGDRPLWQRSPSDPDALCLRLGRGDLASAGRVVGGPAAVVTDVPVCLSVAEHGVTGVYGARTVSSGLMRSLVFQAAALHSPAELRIVVIAPQHAEEWAWARWLPHVVIDGATAPARLGFDRAQAATRLQDLSAPRCAGDQSRTLVVVDGTNELRGSAGAAALLAAVPDRTSILWCASQCSDLPGECRAVVECADAGHPELRLVTDGVAQVVSPDLLAADVAEAGARDLAPLRAGSSAERPALPRAVRWSDVNRTDLRDREHAATSLVDAWARGPSTRITLGTGSGGAVEIDLRADGPHALIAGTTGAGKSELLMSMVAGLAALNRPNHLSFLLIDHKGGAALSRFAGLPHTVGVVTDLDPASTRRALQSLGAELRRREGRLAAVGAVDLEAFLAADPDESLGRLLIVVDEFAAVAEEHPDFVRGLVGIAQRGRSLGIHLILATQRPDGVVSADIRANTRLRICLGVAREQESRDVIDCPDAAAISRTTPGRGYVRVGPGDLRVFQTARIGGVRTTPLDVSATISPAATLGDPLPAPPTELDDSDLDVLIDAARTAAEAAGCTPVDAPWLPPLPDRLWLSDLAAPGRHEEIAWGRLDLPASGAQPALVCDVGNGACTIIAGTARSGRTSAAVSVITALAAHRSPDDLRIWAVDSAAGLGSVERLPHCGAVIPAHDVARVMSLLDHLDAEVSRRRHRTADSSAAMLLVVDSWEGLVDAVGSRPGADLADRVARLAADGPSAGLHLVLTGSRGLLTGRLAAVATDRIVLRLADPADFVVIGISTRDLPRQLPPGRGVRASDLALLQVAMADAATTEAATNWPAPTEPVRRFDPLPEQVGLDALRGGAVSGRVILGLEADTLRTVALDPSAITRPFLVAGPSGSGRSSALLLIARQLRGRRLAVCCSDHSPLARCAGAVRLPRDDQEHAVALLDSLGSGGTPADVICDDLDLLAEGPLWARIDAAASGEPAGDPLLVVAASTDTVTAAFRGPLAQVRRRRLGLVLGAISRHDAVGFGIALPASARGDELGPPGRGWLVDAGSSRRVQLADPALPRSEVLQVC